MCLRLRARRDLMGFHVVDAEYHEEMFMRSCSAGAHAGFKWVQEPAAAVLAKLRTARGGRAGAIAAKQQAFNAKYHRLRIIRATSRSSSRWSTNRPRGAVSKRHASLLPLVSPVASCYSRPVADRHIRDYATAGSNKAHSSSTGSIVLYPSRLFSQGSVSYRARAAAGGHNRSSIMLLQSTSRACNTSSSSTKLSLHASAGIYSVPQAAPPPETRIFHTSVVLNAAANHRQSNCFETRKATATASSTTTAGSNLSDLLSREKTFKKKQMGSSRLPQINEQKKRQGSRESLLEEDEKDQELLVPDYVMQPPSCTRDLQAYRSTSTSVWRSSSSASELHSHHLRAARSMTRSGILQSLNGAHGARYGISAVQESAQLGRVREKPQCHVAAGLQYNQMSINAMALFCSKDEDDDDMLAHCHTSSHGPSELAWHQPEELEQENNTNPKLLLHPVDVQEEARNIRAAAAHDEVDDQPRKPCSRGRGAHDQRWSFNSSSSSWNLRLLAKEFMASVSSAAGRSRDRNIEKRQQLGTAIKSDPAGSWSRCWPGAGLQPGSWTSKKTGFPSPICRSSGRPSEIDRRSYETADSDEAPLQGATGDHHHESLKWSKLREHSSGSAASDQSAAEEWVQSRTRSLYYVKEMQLADHGSQITLSSNSSRGAFLCSGNSAYGGIRTGRFRVDLETGGPRLECKPEYIKSSSPPPPPADDAVTTTQQLRMMKTNSRRRCRPFFYKRFLMLSPCSGTASCGKCSLDSELQQNCCCTQNQKTLISKNPNVSKNPNASFLGPE